MIPQKLKYTFLILLAFSMLNAVAQVFIDVDWLSADGDTILPYYGTQIPLGRNCRDSGYSAAVEFPELEMVTREEREKWNLDSYQGVIAEHPVISSVVSFSREEGFLDIGFVPIIKKSGCFYKIKSFKLSVEQPAASGRIPRYAAGPAERYAASSLLSSGRWYKICIPSSGIYRLTPGLLASMGFRSPENVRIYGRGGALLPEYGLETLDDDLYEIPLWRDGENILFYGRGPVSWKRQDGGAFVHETNTYSSYGYYFLTESDDAEPLVMETAAVCEESSEPVTEYTECELYEKDGFSWFHSGRRFYENYDFAGGQSRTYRFDMEGLCGDTVLMNIAFASDGKLSSSLRADVNGTEAGRLYLMPVGSSDKASVSSASFVCKNLFTEDSKVQLTHIRNGVMSGRLDYVELNYRRKLSLRGNYTVFRVSGSGAMRFSIDSDRNTVVWRIDSKGTASLIPSVNSGGVCLTAAVMCHDDDEFVVLDPDADFDVPAIAGAVPNQNLHATGTVDMVIVVPSGGKLIQQAQRLADAHREYDGMKVEVVTAAQIYNEFSSGTPDATAYRRYMKMLYDRAPYGTAPRYLLLFGDGAWDNRMITSDWRSADPDDYLLCYESENSESTTRSYVADDYFGLLGDGKGLNILGEKVDIGIGRFPVTSASDARVLVDKTISYMKNGNAGPWQNNVLILGDDGDDNIHMLHADMISKEIAEVNPALKMKKIYWDSYKLEVSAARNSYPAVREDILRTIGDGVLMVNYSGHGSADVLSHELVLDKSDFASMKSDALPLWITASCDITPFDAAFGSIGKSALLNPDGGAVAMFTTARTVYSTYNIRMNTLFTRQVLASGNTLGDAVRIAKVGLVTPGSEQLDYSENKLHFVLLGDPALRLAVPELHVVFDSVSSGEFIDGVPRVSAGGKVAVEGHIENADHTLNGSFNGILTQSVYDSERLIVTNNNADDAEKPFEYTDYDKILYSGTDSVRNGRFSFTFPVPKDINYSDEHGRIVAYAVSEDGLSASGRFEDFIVGGTSSYISSDSVGPDIRMYLNSPDFSYGESTNSTPFLVAELSDPDGINSSGNGVGHDLLLVIDNDPARTYVLNDRFSQTDGDYRSGRITYSIPKLTDGKHRLMLRAWDVLNNSSVSYLEFVSSESDVPAVPSVSLSHNPVSVNTSFVIAHNRPGSIRSIEISVTDAGGRNVWNRPVADSSVSGVEIVDWNASDNAGRKLHPGIYMYRVVLTDTDSSVSSVAGKFVVTGNSY